MLPDDEYRALKKAHLERQNRPPIPERVNYYKLAANDSSYQLPSSAWSDSTTSEVGGFSVLTNFKKEPSKDRRTRREPRVKSRPAGVSASNPIQSAAGPNNVIHPNTEARFGGFDRAAYEAAQASTFGTEARLLDAKSSTQQQPRPRSVRHAQGRSSKARTYQQPHNSDDAEHAELNRSSAADLLAFSEAIQGISHDPPMPMNLGPEHAQYWASRQAAMGKVSLQHRRSEMPLSNESRLATKQVQAPQDRVSGRGCHSMNTSEGLFVPELTKHQQCHDPVYEDLFDRPQPATPPRKRKNVFKRVWKKILGRFGGESHSVQPGR